MMDLAALRIRDTLKNLGDLAELADRYEAVTGVTIDHDVVEYQTVLYNALSVVSVGPPLADPVPGTDWISYLAWYVNGGDGGRSSRLPRSVATRSMRSRSLTRDRHATRLRSGTW